MCVIVQPLMSLLACLWIIDCQGLNQQKNTTCTLRMLRRLTQHGRMHSSRHATLTLPWTVRGLLRCPLQCVLSECLWLGCLRVCVLAFMLCNALDCRLLSCAVLLAWFLSYQLSEVSV